MAENSTNIYETLKKEIISLKIKPGEKLEESDMCERFSVTRPPIRTVFQRLQDIGLLEVVPYKGATVSLISLSAVHQMIHLRTAVETWTIRDFISTNPSAIDIEKLEHIVRLQKLIYQADVVDEKEFFRLDSEMHQFWFDRMKCSNIWSMIQSDINYERFRMLDFVGTKGYINIVKDHEKLIDAIKHNNKKDIVPILSVHLNAGLARMGNLIMNDYKEYFAYDEENNEYWVNYNANLALGNF